MEILVLMISRGVIRRVLRTSLVEIVSKQGRVKLWTKTNNVRSACHTESLAERGVSAERREQTKIKVTPNCAGHHQQERNSLHSVSTSESRSPQQCLPDAHPSRRWRRRRGDGRRPSGGCGGGRRGRKWRSGFRVGFSSASEEMENGSCGDRVEAGTREVVDNLIV